MTDEEMAQAITTLEQTLDAQTALLTRIVEVIVQLETASRERHEEAGSLVSRLTHQVDRLAGETERALDELVASRAGVRKTPRSEPT